MHKRRGNTSFRLSVKPTGQVALSMPYWTPYWAGEKFIKDRQPWILKHLKNQPNKTLKNGAQIGKSHRLYYLNAGGPEPKVKLGPTTIQITSTLPLYSKPVQAKALVASEKALKVQSEILIPERLSDLSIKHQLPYKELKIRKLTARWGSCSSTDVITVSYFLIQLPWGLIDYVLLHELAHTKHMNHSPQFWSFIERLVPDAKSRRKELRTYMPQIMPS